ncbi:tRNA pseudouridine(38-40) synthase TruA [Patulibacter sp.]|uniref:tRNA pseudouridine synthase A n=1 Tax=Patulibacter sp. TaxID=1912859 RepID=UPI002722A3BB|nr:tRNA pseudouridine synthase A [Patulibacter sp.]MDO9408764.1 tRNA pseudouridine synthase A [Patulibacter sp.]
MGATRLDIEYDGTGHWGWAAQPGTRTVHGELARALSTILRTPTTLTVAGRTDRGVHAVAQVASYDGELPDLYSLNSVLPDDVAVRRAIDVPGGFDARRDATSRTYRFRLFTRREPSPFYRRHSLWWPYPLDEDLLDDCARTVVGTHDFTAFTPAETQHVHFRRRIRRALWVRDGEQLDLWIEGDAFLRHMNRILVGTMIEIAGGRRDPEDLPRLLRGARRPEAGITLPPQGLHLAGVGYADELGGPALPPPGWGTAPWAAEVSGG